MSLENLGNILEEKTENEKNNETIRELLSKLVVGGETSKPHANEGHGPSRPKRHDGEGPSRPHTNKHDEEPSQPKSQHAHTHYSTSEGFYNSHHDDDYYQGPPRQHRPRHETTTLREPRFDLPPFHGKDNAHDYLDWEMKVEQLFTCHNVGEERKVPMATLSFQGYAMYWWTSLERERRTHHEPPIQYWNELSIPPYFERELMDKLQRLQQRSLSVEEYRKQMELLMMRVGIREEERTTIARFQSGLNLKIRDKVELLPYRDLNQLVQLCVRVEQQIRRKPTLRKESTSYPIKDFKKEGQPSYSKERPLKEKSKEKPSNDTRTSSIKCFKCLGRGHIASQCPTKKTMIIRDNEILSEERTSSSSSLIAQRLLTNQLKEQDQSQRDNLFHSRCKIFKKTCSLIVDSGSCNNFVIQRLVDKFHLTTIAHPKSYKLQWLNEDGPIKVKDQVSVPFYIGKYKDEVLCDIIPMDASHILLGRPWQHDRKAIHDGVSNKIHLVHLGKKHTLTPLTPSQVLEDQIFMKKKFEEEKKRKN
uniref:CCHC-type domain-containing protein n=1 Tax=Cajanus cajan TaxID=3821 RepID=A0A151TRZ5_CAJCA|nr:hypothetical protein KK1_009043 [Cajanus cajan]